MEYQLALILVINRQHKEARELLTKIAERSARYRKYAGQKLAGLDLAEKRWDDCIERCRQLWKDQPPADPGELLQIWGTAYENAGDLKNAVRCYSGRAPE